ncbi:MAG TPA: AsmA family protein [Parvibaculum sp.]
MSRWIAAAAGALVLLIAVIVALPLLIPTSVYKQRIIAVVKAQTGRDLSIGGDVGLSFFPRLAVKVDDVRLSNAGWAEDADMASMKEMRAALEIMPLFHGAVEIRSFTLVNPVIHLEVKADGTPNWQFEAPAGATVAPSSSTPPPSAPPSSGQSAGAGGFKQIRLGDISIENGEATYRNAQSGAALAFEKVNLDLSLPSLDDPFSATGSLVWNSEPLTLSLNAQRPRALTEGGDTAVEFSLKSAKIDAAYKGTLHPLGGLKFGGIVDLDIASVRDLASWLGSPLPPGSGFGPLTIQGTASGGGTDYTFSDAKIGFDGMSATGTLALQTGGKRPLVKGNLAFGRIDANTYLAGDGSESAKPATATESGGGKNDDGWSDDPIDLTGLRAVDADISLSTQELLVKAVKIGESALELKIDNGVMTIDLSKLALYDGAGSGSLTLDGSGRVPEMAASFSIAGVSAEPLLSDAAGFTRLEGLSALELSVNAAGRSQREMVNALNGKGEVKFTNGAIKGVNVAQLARTVFQGAATGWQSGGSQDTDFSELGGTFTITNGILKNDDFKMLSPLIRVTGAGVVDLPHKKLDYRVEPKLAATLEGQGGGEAKGIEVPVIIDGPWSKPRFRPDLAAMLKNKDQTIDTLKSLKGEGGKELLKSLFGK